MNNPLIEILSETGLVFRTKELNEQGLSNYEIGKLVTEGIIEKLYQGVYTLGDIDNLKLTDINVIVENGIISLKSAAFYYKLTTEEEGKITITLNRDQKPPKIPFDLFSYYYTTSRFYDIGLKIIDQNGRKIKIYDVERTVCDILRHRAKYDSYLIREILENYLKSEVYDIDKLIMYAKELRIYNVLKQYLEILGGV
ncbi:MAG: type IV toxin-antitoxin system AbiEi family antitoxin domain-containing protein [Mycoplasmatales bacterium]